MLCSKHVPVFQEECPPRHICCRDAGESVLAFLHRLFEQATLERCSKQAAEQLLVILAPKGGNIFRMLLAGAAGALPHGRIQNLSEAIVSLLQVSKSSLLIACLRLDRSSV